MEDVLSRLNPIQQEIVKDTEGMILTLAGAGSGKTRVLTHRIAYLIENHVRPWNILAVTFTNKAAREMKERIVSISGPEANDIWIGTFHGICHRILRRHGNEIGLTNFIIVDEKEKKQLIKQACEACSIDYDADFVGNVIGNAKNDLLSPEQCIIRAQSKHEKDIANVYMEYERLKQEQSYIDFDDMIMKTVMLLQNVAEVREGYQNQFRYVMADEGQDTNPAQYTLLNLLTAHHGNLFIVADIDQSIYKWRGAKVQNMIKFQEAYPDARLYLLEQNYRSSANIVNAANAVIEHNEERIEKTSWTDNPEGDPISVFQADDDSREADFVASEIQHIVMTENRAYRDFAVLYRTGRQSRQVELAMTQLGIRYQVVGGSSFYDRREIKDIVAYLRVIANEFDALAMDRIINVPKRGIGDTTVGKIEDYAKECGIPFSKAVEKIEDVDKISKATKTKIQAFVDMIADLRSFAENGDNTIVDIIQEVFQKTAYLEQFDPEKDEDATRLGNIDELLNVASEWDQQAEEGKTILDFLSETTLSSDVDDMDDGDYVSLMTVHSSKGLEFPYVFIIGAEENIFPHSRSLGDPAEIEEERRLAYVAITRAEQKLYITHCTNRYDYNDPRPKYNKPSRFIAEIPKGLIRRIG